MKRTKSELWARFQKYCTEYPTLGMSFDLSRIDFPDDLFEKNQQRIEEAFQFMNELENGAIANPEEKRMVGHYWLRNPEIAPDKENIREDIEKTLQDTKDFAAEVHAGEVQGAGGAFKNLLVVGIGGSALGPQFVSSALGNPLTDKMAVHFFDNTDPDGMDRVLARLAGEFNRTLTMVISKSGGTKETRNGMLEVQAAYERIGLNFGAHAVAITGVDSELDKYASEHNWIKRFPMWDWVGGRTSETSVVGLLPAALQGLDIDGMLAGAKACDEVTRVADVQKNPAAQMALVVDYIDKGKAMVVLPYKDRLELFSKYLQQLVMESLGKELDLKGNVVNQGLTVFGNKGSTDQHAYIQQLREGPNNFFAVFIEVLKDRFSSANNLIVENEATSGDYLQGFLLGTRSALYENGRESFTITIKDVSPFSVGMLIAFFERFVGFYAKLMGINAYHQPGVQAGKLAADDVLFWQAALMRFLRANPGKAFTAEKLATDLVSEVAKMKREKEKDPAKKRKVKVEADPETVYKICEHLVVNGRGIGRKEEKSRFKAKYFWCG